MRWRPIASGALSLIVLEVLVTSKQTGRVGSLLQLPAAWAQHLIDPHVAAIPDRSGGGSPGSTPAPAPAPTVYSLPPSTSNKPSTPPILTA